MSLDEKTNEELLAITQSTGKLKLMVILGVITIPIGIGVLIIIYAYYRLTQVFKSQRILGKRTQAVAATSETEHKSQCRICSTWNDSGSNNCVQCGNQLQVIPVDGKTHPSLMSDRQLADTFKPTYYKGVILSLVGFFGSMIIIGIPVLIYGLMQYSKAMKMRKEIMKRSKMGTYNPYDLPTSPESNVQAIQ